MIAVATLLLTGCSGDRTDHRPSPGAPDRRPSNVRLDQRPFKQLKSDEPGGPRHRRPLPSRPTNEQLTASSELGANRAGAERFAILVNHALEDQTSDSPTDVLDEYGADLPPEAVAALDETRSLPGNHVVPGSRSFVRSTLRETASGSEATVFVVEKIASPALGDAPGEPFVFWAQTRLTVAWAVGRWKLTDYQSAGASEYPKFSKWTWRDTMDSGRGWRRFDVAGSD